MIFHVINRETGEPIGAQGFWAIDEDGTLFDVIDGWGCEGGGGPSRPEWPAMVVLGAYVPKPAAVVEHVKLSKAFPCAACNKKFTTYEGSVAHFDKVHM